MRKRILYLMHVDWDWIKQRPHYIAENLSKHYDLLIVYPMSKNRSLLTNNTRDGVFLRPFIRVPSTFRQEIGFLYKANKLYLRRYFKYLIKEFDPDYIWVTFPELYDYLPLDAKEKAIIYDCMDDAIAFSASNNFKLKLLEAEKRLIDRASLVFVSSKDLARKLGDRQFCENKTVLVRNAFGGAILANGQLHSNDYSSKTVFKIGYIGTVSSWFDFDSLHFTLKHLDNIEYHIIGPVDADIRPWSHERIKFHGPVDHNDLYTYAKDFDCLIMPFKVNELISSVDPIKLYEYINFNKPVISVFYNEIEWLSPYVSFYSTKEDLLGVLDSASQGRFCKKYSDSKRIDFLTDNSWDVRVGEIVRSLEQSRTCMKEVC